MENMAYYIEKLLSLEKESLCCRRHVGAILVSEDGLFFTSATNNPFSDKTICQKQGCLRKKMNIPSGQRIECCRCIHSEANVIAQYAQKGISTRNSILYTSLFPCSVCSKLIIVAGIKKVVYLQDYSDNLGLQLFGEANVELYKYIKS